MENYLLRYKRKFNASSLQTRTISGKLLVLHMCLP
jgi:hypothetical protein